jgi:hypothetical protein
MNTAPSLGPCSSVPAERAEDGHIPTGLSRGHSSAGRRQARRVPMSVLAPRHGVGDVEQRVASVVMRRRLLPLYAAVVLLNLALWVPIENTPSNGSLVTAVRG